MLLCNAGFIGLLSCKETSSFGQATFLDRFDVLNPGESTKCAVEVRAQRLPKVEYDLPDPGNLIDDAGLVQGRWKQKLRILEGLEEN